MIRRVCLVEDDPTIREIVSEKLASRGYAVESFSSADGLMHESPCYDLYILDLMLAGESSGLELCRHLRAEAPTLPILILSALSEPGDRVEGLRSGADDYLPKPFEMEELLLRVDGMLKRRSWYRQLPRNASRFEWADSAIDFVRLEGRKGPTSFSLTEKECMLMKLLVEREGEVVSRDEILDKVWGYQAFPTTRTIDNFVMRLRKYFEDDSREPRFLHSVRGTGYKFTAGESV